MLFTCAGGPAATALRIGQEPRDCRGVPIFSTRLTMMQSAGSCMSDHPRLSVAQAYKGDVYRHRHHPILVTVA